MTFQRNKKIQSVLKILFLILFVCYAGSTTLFFHSHIINDETIVHSHPYKADEKGKPIHTHTESEIQLIQNLSSWYCFSKIAFTFTFKALLPSSTTLTIYKIEFIFTDFTEYVYLLRPPPSLFFLN